MSLDYERAERNLTLGCDAWCPGCGLFRLVSGRHRADCTAKPLNDDEKGAV